MPYHLTKTEQFKFLIQIALNILQGASIKTEHSIFSQ